MAVWHGKKGRTKTGGEITIHRKKRRFELGSLPLHVRIGKEEKFVKKTKGGGKRIKARSVEFANVLNPESREIKKVKILDIIENRGDPDMVRRGIITKGCIIRTEIGNARVTSRPSQHGTVNALALTTEEKK